MMDGIYLLLGSNLGDRHLNISSAINRIKLIATIRNTSSIYKTAAWGKTDQPSFYNQIARIETQLSPKPLLNKLLEIENDIGRMRIEKWGERVIDIDILYYNNEVINSQQLIVPHKEIQNRLFTLIPMCEIAPDFVHPVLKVTQRQLLEQCTDQLEVAKLDTSNR